MSEGDCPICKQLLDHAAVSIRAHLRALSRLDLAVQRGKEDVSVLEKFVRECSIAREDAVAKCAGHRDLHNVKVRAAGSGWAAE